MPHQAFQRALGFLNYSSSAKWVALCSAVVTSCLYIAFLPLLALFADVLVHTGSIPTYSSLSPQLKTAIAEKLTKIAAENEDKMKERLEKLGLVVADGVPAQSDSLSMLLGITGENPLGNSKELSNIKQEIAWRWHVFEYLEQSVGTAAAQKVTDETKKVVAEMGPMLALELNVPDCGLLSLVVRVQHRWDNSITSVIARFFPWSWESGNRTYMFGLAIVSLVLVILRATFFFLNKYYSAIAVTEATTRLRRATYNHTYRLGSLAIKSLGPSEAISVFTRHIENVSDGLFGTLTVQYKDPVKFILLFAFAAAVNVWLTLAFLMFAFLVWLIGGQTAAYFRSQGRYARQRSAEELALLQESLQMMRLVKIYLMEPFNKIRVERQISSYHRYLLRQFRGEAIYYPLLVMLAMIAVIILLMAIGLVVTNGQLGLASAIVLITSIVSLYWPFRSWLDHRNTFKRARESATVLFEFLDRPGEVGQSVEAEFLPPLNSKLEFVDVSLLEPGTKKRLLKSISMNIEAGQRVALVGANDAEKYAIVYLIPRFLDPSVGEIRIDGKNLRWVTLDSLRVQIAMVLQHNLVFNDTVANNIGCGDKSYTLPQLIEVAKIAHAHNFIQQLPKGYETPIGEMGHSLSISEQFRIALARAILRDPALIIVEEPHVPLSDEVKDLLDDTMARILPGRTILFIPHRLSTIKHCDKIFLLHNGTIVATGDHKELLSKNELYRHLQYLEFNEFSGVVKMPNSN